MTSYGPLRKQEWLVCRPEKSTLLALLHEQPQAFELRGGADAPAWLRMARHVCEAVCYVHSQVLYLKTSARSASDVHGGL